MSVAELQEVDPNAPERRLQSHGLALQHEAIPLGQANADRGRLGEKDSRQMLTIRWACEHTYQKARPILFHLKMLERNVERSVFEEPFHQIVEMF